MNELIKKLTNDLLASYANLGGINHLDGVNLPSKSTIAEITQDLLRLLFPGYFDDHLIHSCELRIETANLMDNVFGRLEDEVYKSLLHSPPEGVKTDEIRHCAHEMTGQLLEKLPDLRELLQTDVESAYNGDPAALNKNEVIVAYPFVEAIAVQRLAHEIFQRKIPLIPRIMTEWAHSRTGIDLHPGARIGSHFFIDHGTGTVVGETSVIGNHVKMYQGVALIGRSLKGGQSLRGVKRHPTIEDKVTLYANATVMGGDTIVGARSTIGANVFLTQSIPPDSLAVTDEVSVKIMNKLEHKPN
ncbi:MAG: serine acetyltransferase [Verrucomicrobia bacterium]|nr:serine acetyltransferase [Verrucomicrobiota bacterium]MBT4273916.1 serine acetyltransferase [Verrucomicrobiota bacterium]MBT5062405.1 serine acetyltransferase [Verrucomicrobiota bacterium]MBT5478956.1 serine acetyltransferase [Verrucomicrobiota bacterium]MBT6237426.1 serine acetyltransferase [Verrucomicrobiota bacterium]